MNVSHSWLIPEFYILVIQISKEILKNPSNLLISAIYSCINIFYQPLTKFLDFGHMSPYISLNMDNTDKKKKMFSFSYKRVTTQRNLKMKFLSQEAKQGHILKGKIQISRFYAFLRK